MCLEPMLCKERSHCSEKPPLTMCRESPCAATEIHQSQKKKKSKKKNLSWLSLPKKKASKLWLTFAISFHAVQVLLNGIFFYLGNLLPYELCIPKINSQSLLQCSLQLAQTHVTWALPADSLTWDFDLEVCDLRKLVPYRKGWLVRAAAESAGLGGWPQDWVPGWNWHLWSVWWGKVFLSSGQAAVWFKHRSWKFSIPVS